MRDNYHRRPEGCTAIVTGGANGIGKAIAEALATDGCRVIVADIDEASGEAVASDLGGRFIRADLCDKNDCGDLIARARNLYGTISILVNNAGFQHVAPIENFPDDRFEAMIRTMLLAPFYLTKQVWRDMRERGWGRIINIGSIHSMVASPNKSAYVTAKHGLLGLTRVAALEGGAAGITVNAVCPAYVRTSLVERQVQALADELNLEEQDVASEVFFRHAAIKRLIEPGEIGSLVRFLCSDDARSVTGAAFSIDLGWTAQ